MNYLLKKLPAFAAGAVVAATLSTGAVAEELALADFLSPQHPYQTDVYGVMAEKVATATDGAVTIKIYPGGELGAGPVEQYNRVVDGVADIAFALPGYTASNFPKTLLTELPGVIDSETGTTKIWENIDYISDEYSRVKLLSIWTNGENVLYSKEPIRSLADVQGLKIRVPSKNAGLMVEAWGGSPVSLPTPEIYNAFQTGVVDAVLIDTTATYAFNLGEVANYVTAGMNGTISPFVLIMNRDRYESLSEAQQSALDEIGREISDIGLAVQLAGVERGAQMIKDAEGKEWIQLSDEAAAEFNNAAASVVEDAIAGAEAEGLPARDYIDALKK